MVVKGSLGGGGRGAESNQLKMLRVLPFFKIPVNQVLALDDSPAANIISMHVVGEGPGAIP